MKNFPKTFQDIKSFFRLHQKKSVIEQDGGGGGEIPSQFQELNIYGKIYTFGGSTL